MRRNLKGLVGAALAFFALGVSASLGAELAPQSPFMPAEQYQGSSKGGSAEVLELRGIMSTSDGTAYWITQKGKRSADWVMLNEKGHDFVVKSVDSSDEAVEVDFHGQTIRLTLLSAKVAPAGPSVPQPAVGALSVPHNPLATTDGGDPTPGEVQARMKAARADALRRRLEYLKANKEAHPGSDTPDGAQRTSSE